MRRTADRDASLSGDVAGNARAALYVLLSFGVVMPNICFKPRPGRSTVQLVRHVYSPDVQRSRTVTLGSLRLEADPEDFASALTLCSGVSLTDADRVAIRDWLLRHGDQEAAARRHKDRTDLEARVRAELKAELMALSTDTLESAVQALEAAARALPEQAAQVAGAGGDVWDSMRPRYLAIHAAWHHLMTVAQNTGVAKRMQRISKARDETLQGG